jgi:hypothetical protein
LDRCRMAMPKQVADHLDADAAAQQSHGEGMAQ